MIQEIQGFSEIYSPVSSIAAANVQKTSPASNVEEAVSQVVKTDTVEISKEGKLASSMISSTSTAATAETAETEPVLSTLSESELDDLVEEGTITEAEKNSELARRKASESAEEATKSQDYTTKANLLDEEVLE